MMDKKLRDFLEAVAKLEQDRETMCVNAIALMCILSAAQLEGKGRVDKHDLAKCGQGRLSEAGPSGRETGTG